MKKTNVLGKGLSSLIPENEFQDIGNEQILNIDINLIKPNKHQPRKHFDDEKLIELANSIKEHGIIQPIIVKPENQFFIIIAGERRWRAAKLLNLKEVPIIIKDLSDVEIVEISLIENIIREDLNPIEEALAYRKLLDEYNLTQEEISKQVSKSRSTIANSLRLLNLDDRIQGYLIEGVLSEGHGRTILGLEKKDEQYIVAQKVIDENLNVRQTEALVRNYNKPVLKKEVRKNEADIYYKDIKAKLENHFNTKVSISNNSKNKGKIEIEYYSPEDLQRIIEILSV